MLFTSSRWVSFPIFTNAKRASFHSNLPRWPQPVWNSLDLCTCTRQDCVARGNKCNSACDDWREPLCTGFRSVLGLMRFNTGSTTTPNRRWTHVPVITPGPSYRGAFFPGSIGAAWMRRSGRDGSRFSISTAFPFTISSMLLRPLGRCKSGTTIGRIHVQRCSSIAPRSRLEPQKPSRALCGCWSDLCF